MLSPRWRKVLRDLWSNTTRTLLVVLSIAVGVFAIGMVGGSRVILIRDLTDTWMAVNPASATLSTEAFGDALVQVVRKMPGVGAAEARRTISVRVGDSHARQTRPAAALEYDRCRQHHGQVGRMRQSVGVQVLRPYYTVCGCRSRGSDIGTMSGIKRSET